MLLTQEQCLHLGTCSHLWFEGCELHHHIRTDSFIVKLRLQKMTFSTRTFLSLATKEPHRLLKRIHLSGFIANVATEFLGTYSHRKFYWTLWASQVKVIGKTSCIVLTIKVQMMQSLHGRKALMGWYPRATLQLKVQWTQKQVTTLVQDGNPPLYAFTVTLLRGQKWGAMKVFWNTTPSLAPQ